MDWVGESTGDGAAKSTNSQADLPQVIDDYEKKYMQDVNMSGFAAPKISTVGIGIIGLGNRGPSLLRNMKLLEGVEIKALCDLRPMFDRLFASWIASRSGRLRCRGMELHPALDGLVG